MSFKSLSVVALVASALLLCAAGQSLAITTINCPLYYDVQGIPSNGPGLYYNDVGNVVNMYGRYYTADYNPGTAPTADPGFRLNFGKYFIDHNTMNPVSGGGLGTNTDLLQLRSADVMHAYIGYDDWGVQITDPGGFPVVWGGTGITSNFAKNDPKGVHAVGLMPAWLYIATYQGVDPTRANDDGTLGYFPELGPAHAFGVDAVIGMYTLFGDTDFDNVITPADFGAYIYSALNPGAVPHPTWSDGDFDGDGVITPADGGLITAAALSGSSGSSGAASVGGSAVPEPATWVMLAAGTLVLLGYRLRRKRA